MTAIRCTTHSGQGSSPTTCSRYSAPPMINRLATKARRNIKRGLAWDMEAPENWKGATVVESAKVFQGVLPLHAAKCRATSTGPTARKAQRGAGKGVRELNKPSPS